MKWTDAESLEYGKMLNDGEISKYDISYFRYDGDTTLKFSSLYFNGDMVPVGDAQKKCVFVEWSLKEYE